MRNVRFLIVLLLTSMTCFAQREAKSSSPKHDPFASYSMGWTPNKELSYSGELGTWGNTSRTSFSVTMDAMRSTAVYAPLTKWVGVKAYYTAYSDDKICYMIYIKNAVQLNNSSQSFVEFGFNPNYTLSRNFLLGVTVGNQAYEGSQWNLFSSVGVVYLFKKHRYG